VIGATERPGSVGRALWENLRAFRGRVFPVNPRRATVLGQPAFATIGDVPEPVDLAVIATPAATVPGLVRECVRAGVRGATILSAGFKEAGAEGAERERQIVAAARGRMRLVGPTCLGVMVPHGSLNATIAGAMARPGRVAFLSQSGALCSAILDWSLREGVGFSAFVSVGGMADVGWGDLIDHLGDDPHTQSIVIYLESIGDARAFLSAARAVSFTKPIVVIKPGRTEAAARAAAQHTGALTGDDAVLDAAFQRAGVLRVDTLEEVFDMAEVFGKQPRPRGPRLAIVTNAGGPAAIAADSLVLAGGQLAPLAPETFAALGRPVPPPDQRAAPLDLLGDADAARYRTAVAAVAADPACDGVLAILTPQAVTDATAVATRLKELLPLAGGKPFLAAWMGGAAVDAGEAVLNAAGIPTFKYSDRAARAFAHLWRYSTHLQSLYETPQLFEEAQGRQVPAVAAAAVLRAARQKRRTSLETGEIARLLGAYGLTPALPVEADTETQVVAAARAAGFPARLVPRAEDAAAASPVVVRDAAGVRLAWRTLKRAAEAAAGKGGFGGVWVSRVLPEPGIDLQLGSRIDPQFGPVLTFGAGGWLGELTPDVAVGLPPLNSTLALRLMEQTRIFRALRAGRGLPGVDLTPLEQGVVRFSQLVAAQPWLRAVRLDPVRLTAAGLVVIGAEVTLHEAGLREAALPTPVIRPYPQQYATTATLRDGTPVLLRPIRPEDEPMMARFHETLSDRSVYYRYFRAISLEHRASHARLARLCFVDYAREMALVTIHRDPASGRDEIIGVGRLCQEPGLRQAEYAIVISDSWQGRGLGTRLLNRLVEIGRKEGLRRITATILTDNVEMQRVSEKVGFTVRRSPDGECVAEIDL
jgi:acetyltransferase